MRPMKKFLVYMSCFFLSLLLAGCKDKQANQREVLPQETIKTTVEKPATKASKKTILCFGNSLTAGYGLDADQAWPHLLQLRLDSLEQAYTVVNAGLSGETTSGGVNRLDWVIKQPIDIFILELGANDMLRGLDVDLTKSKSRVYHRKGYQEISRSHYRVSRDAGATEYGRCLREEI